MESGTPARDTAWAMSSENVEVVLAAFRRLEDNDMTGFGALLDPGVGATAAAGWPEHGPWIGADALVTQLERVRTEWSEHRIAQVEVLAEKGEWVVIEYSWEADGATERDRRRVRCGRCLQGAERAHRRGALSLESRRGAQSSRAVGRCSPSGAVSYPRGGLGRGPARLRGNSRPEDRDRASPIRSPAWGEAGFPRQAHRPSGGARRHLPLPTRRTLEGDLAPRGGPGRGRLRRVEEGWPSSRGGRLAGLRAVVCWLPRDPPGTQFGG